MMEAPVDSDGGEAHVRAPVTEPVVLCVTEGEQKDAQSQQSTRSTSASITSQRMLYAYFRRGGGVHSDSASDRGQQGPRCDWTPGCCCCGDTSTNNSKIVILIIIIPARSGVWGLEEGEKRSSFSLRAAGPPFSRTQQDIGESFQAAKNTEEHLQRSKAKFSVDLRLGMKTERRGRGGEEQKSLPVYLTAASPCAGSPSPCLPPAQCKVVSAERRAE
ncbi:hypothetical protein NQZ68_002489 [Dissostichus eleginoides]|nr:hypothetical protein NQZ68_002489 [Dissostichus eleginoides]